MVLLSSNVEARPAQAQPGQVEGTSLSACIPMVGLPSWMRAAATCGFSVDAAFLEAGIHLDVNQPNGAVVSAETLLRAIAVCVARSTTHYFPLVLGEAYVFDRFPQVEAFLATSPSMRQAIEAFPWIRAMQLPWLWVTLEETESEAALVVSLDAELARCPEADYVIEIVVAACRKFAKSMLGQSLKAIARPMYAVQFQQARPENAAQYQDFFPCQVQFGAPRNALVFHKEMLDMPLEGALPAVHGQARLAIVQQIEASQPRFASTSAVRMVLESRPELLQGGLDQVAEVLGVHARTLQRRLQAEGFRFADLQAQAKYARARQMLTKKAISMETISAELGFSDRRAFTYAFKRWAGVSPSTYRAQVLQSTVAALRHG
jgi:AraC-like DNA-binding protein